jgi:hypothetical protein
MSVVSALASSEFLGSAITFGLTVALPVGTVALLLRKQRARSEDDMVRRLADLEAMREPPDTRAKRR